MSHSKKDTGETNKINDGSAQEMIAMQLQYQICHLSTMSVVREAYLRLVSLHMHFFGYLCSSATQLLVSKNF